MKSNHLGASMSPIRTITSHIVNPANDRLVIDVLDEPSHGGASHKYAISFLPDPDNLNVTVLHFQDGPIDADGNGVNGITHEALIAVLVDRLQGFQSGRYACEENRLALEYLRAAQEQLQNRTRARMARGVEGTHTI